MDNLIFMILDNVAFHLKFMGEIYSLFFSSHKKMVIIFLQTSKYKTDERYMIYDEIVVKWINWHFALLANCTYSHPIWYISISCLSRLFESFAKDKYLTSNKQEIRNRSKHQFVVWVRIFRIGWVQFEWFSIVAHHFYSNAFETFFFLNVNCIWLHTPSIEQRNWMGTDSPCDTSAKPTDAYIVCVYNNTIVVTMRAIRVKRYACVPYISAAI